MSQVSKNKDFILKTIAYFLIAIGIFLRLAHYFSNRSLWLDEAMVSLNIINKPFISLLGPLDRNQAAPIGFLFVEKFLVCLLGNNEYVLRLIPLSCGILSILLFFHLSKKLFGPFSSLVALGLFVILPSLIYYSAEVKQYSGDVLMTLALIHTSIKLKEYFTSQNLIIFGLLGMISMCFSFPAIFVFIGVSISLCLHLIRNKKIKNLLKLLGICFMWVGELIVLYFINLSKLNKANLEFFGNSSFMSYPLKIDWFVNLFKSIIEFTNTDYFGIGCILCIIGLLSLIRRNIFLSSILLLPLIITVIISGFHLYPLPQRLLLFIIPSFIILISQGIEYLKNNLLKELPVLIFVLLIALFFGPVKQSSSDLINSYNIKEDTKTVLKYFLDHKKKDDVLYLSAFTTPQYNYYEKKLLKNRKKDFLLIEGICSLYDVKKYTDELDTLNKYKRVWVLFHAGEEGLYIHYLGKKGIRLNCFTSAQTSLCLYGFKKI